METPLRDVLVSIRSLEPMPAVALRVLELSQRADVVPSDLVRVLETEPALTAKVLRLTNSAYYGFQRRIASLDEAGTMLGTNALVGIVLTGCGAHYFHTHGSATAKERERRWKRSVTQALASGLLARVTQTSDRHRAYTAGLLQDVGELVLARFAAGRESALADAIAHGASRLDAERAVFGLDHAEVGARLAQHWSFPELLIDTIRCHHTPEKATVDPVLCFVVHLGSQVVDEFEREAGLARGPGFETSHAALDELGLDALALTAIHEPLERELAQASELIESGA